MHSRVFTRKLFGGIFLVEVYGDIDIYTVNYVKGALDAVMDEGHYDVIVNLEEAEFIDSNGLRVLLHAYDRSHKNDGHLLLINQRSFFMKILKMTRLSGHFNVFDNTADAIKHLEQLASKTRSEEALTQS